MKGLADFLLPQLCACCARPALGGFCKTCIADLRRLCLGFTCPVCGRPDPSSVCSDCKSGNFQFDRAQQAFEFRGPVRSAIHRLKYGGEALVAKSIAQAVSELTSTLPSGRSVALTWIPASKARIQRRGIDHGKLLAQAVSEVIALPAVELLTWAREHPPQTSLVGESRRRNLAGALKCRLPPPPVVAVIDDVFTTGATASEAARSLKLGGAGRVEAIAVARAHNGRFGDSQLADSRL